MILKVNFYTINLEKNYSIQSKWLMFMNTEIENYIYFDFCDTDPGILKIKL